MVTPYRLFWSSHHLIDKFHKLHNAPVPYPTMHHSDQKCAHFCPEWWIVGYGTGALWALWDCSFTVFSAKVYLLLPFSAKMWAFQFINTLVVFYKWRLNQQTVIRSSYLHNGISYTGKIAALYWTNSLLLPSVKTSEHLLLQKSKYWHHVIRWLSARLQYLHC